HSDADTDHHLDVDTDQHFDSDIDCDPNLERHAFPHRVANADADTDEHADADHDVDGDSDRNHGGAWYADGAPRRRVLHQRLGDSYVLDRQQRRRMPGQRRWALPRRNRVSAQHLRLGGSLQHAVVDPHAHARQDANTYGDTNPDRGPNANP